MHRSIRQPLRPNIRLLSDEHQQPRNRKLDTKPLIRKLTILDLQQLFSENPSVTWSINSKDTWLVSLMNTSSLTESEMNSKTEAFE